ncbi:50S ribosomal protein L6 [bacterium]|nr:50S ribosomal protein L6 [bacterium]
MSRLGKLPIEVPEGVNVELSGQDLNVSGKLGKLNTKLHRLVKVEFADKKLTVKPADESREARAMWGMSRAIVNNLVQGVSKGYEKRLEILGVGYRAAVQGDILNLTLGYSHEVRFGIPQGIKIVAEKPTTLVISGSDKEKVGQIAAEIRSLRPPEPYKGKGVRYDGEYINMKEGKKK